MVKNFRHQHQRPKKNTLVIGREAVIKAMQEGKQLERIYLQSTVHGPVIDELKKLAVEKMVPINKVPVEKLNAITNVQHQGVIAYKSAVKYQELQTIIDFKVDNAYDYHITYHLYNEMSEAIFSFSPYENFKMKKGHNDIICTFPKSFFQSGQYSLSLFIIKDGKSAIFYEKMILNFTIVDSMKDINGFTGREPGYIKPKFQWMLN